MPDDLEAQVRAALNHPCAHWQATKPKYLGDVRLIQCPDCLPAAVARALTTLDEEWRADWAVACGELKGTVSIGITPMQAALATLREGR